MKIRKCEPIYTGGGVYVFYCELDDGSFAIAEDNWFDVALYNANPWLSEEPYETPFEPEWETDHLIRYMEEPENRVFFVNMLNWVFANNPDGNYATEELEHDLEVLKGDNNG